jgi:hypothetical protein
MEVFIRNLPGQTTEKGLRKFFKPYLEALSISIFSCEKMYRARIATLTFLFNLKGCCSSRNMASRKVGLVFELATQMSYNCILWARQSSVLLATSRQTPFRYAPLKLKQEEECPGINQR